MRTAFTTTFRNSLADLQRLSQSLADTQAEISSGKRVTTPSDDPGAVQVIIGEAANTADIDQYIRAGDSVTSRLTVADTVLSDLIDKITQAQARATSAQGSEMTATQRDALANELTGIRDAVYTDMTTRFRGTYVFAGTASTTSPYSKDVDGNVTAYAGNASTMSIDVTEQKSVVVSFDGDAVLKGSAANDLFGTLQNLITAIGANDKAAMATAVTELKDHFNRVVAAQSGVGANLSQLEDDRARLQALRRASQNRLDANEKVDYAEAITQMNQAETAYRAALGVTSTVGNLSLLDYLK